MPILTSEGIVLRTLKYSENSIICDIFTKEYGLKSFIISATKSQKSKLALLQIMNLVDIIFYDSEQNKLHRIKELHLNYPYQHLNLSVIPSAVGTFITEVTRNAIKEHDVDTPLYLYIKDSFISLDKLDSAWSNFYIGYLIGLCSYLGFQPNPNYDDAHVNFDLMAGEFTNISGDVRHTLSIQESNLLGAQLTDSNAINRSKEQNKMLTDALLKYYHYHIPSFKPIKSLEVIRAILA